MRRGSSPDWPLPRRSRRTREARRRGLEAQSTAGVPPVSACPDEELAGPPKEIPPPNICPGDGLFLPPSYARDPTALNSLSSGRIGLPGQDHKHNVVLSGLESGGRNLAMRIGVLTPVRLVGEGIAASLAACAPPFEVVAARDFAGLRALADSHSPPRLVIVDVTQAVALHEVRAFHAEFPEMPLLALGLREREAEIVEHGRAGFVGYVRRDEGVAELRCKVEDAVAGRMSCPPEIAAAIMRGLFRAAPPPAGFDLDSLTPREGDVARLVSRGLANKEIARHLGLSESTVKHHVHAILAKLGLTRRANLMRSMRDDPWFNEPGRRSG